MPSPADSARTTVLIVSADPTAAALLGGLVETLGYDVEFGRVNEPSDDTLRRVRPRVCMLDCATTEACSDATIARAMMRGVSVVLVGPAPLLAGMRDLASRHGVEMVFTPPQPGPLGEVLDRAARRASA